MSLRTRVVAACHIQSTLWYFLPTLIGAILPLLTLPAITAALGPDEYGAWVVATVFGSFVSGLGNLGLTVAFDRNYFEFTDPRLNASLLWGSAAVVSMLLFLLVSASWIARNVVAELILQLPGKGALVAWTATALSVGSIKQYFLIFFRNRNEARRFALFSIDESILSAILTILFVYVLRVGTVGLAWGPLLASTFVLISLLYSVSRQVPIAFDLQPLVASMRMSLPLLPRILFSGVGTQFDKWVVGFMGGTGSAGIYAIGQKLANVVFLLATALENKFQPRTYQIMFEGSPEAGSRIGALLTPFAYLTAGCGVVIALFATEAVALLTTKEYAAAVAISYILVLQYALTFFSKQPQLLFAKKTGQLSIFSITSIVVAASLTGLGALTWGMMGAAIGALMSRILTTIVFVRLSQHAFRIEFETLRLVQYYGMLAVVGSVLSLGYWQAWGWVALVLVKIVLLSTYVWIGLRDGMFSRLGWVVGGPLSRRR